MIADRFTDPARFSFAHGGKDRHPFPVPLRFYDETVRVLKSAVHAAKLGREGELGALRRLDEQARLLERCASGPPVEELIAGEREQSHNYGGRTVFGWQTPRHRSPASGLTDLVATVKGDIDALVAFTYRVPAHPFSIGSTKSFAHSPIDPS